MTNDPYRDPRAGGPVPPRPPQPPLGAEPYVGDAPSGYGIGGSGGSFGDPGQPGVHPNNLPPVQREDAHMVPPGNPPAPPHQPRHDSPVAVDPQRRPQPPVESPPADADESYAIYQAEDRSIGEIASDVLGNASTLIRQEVALAKAEAAGLADQDILGIADKGSGGPGIRRASQRKCHLTPIRPGHRRENRLVIRAGRHQRQLRRDQRR